MTNSDREKLLSGPNAPLISFTTKTMTKNGIRCKVRAGTILDFEKYIWIKWKPYHPVICAIGNCMMAYRDEKNYEISDAIRELLKENNIGVGQRHDGTTCLIYHAD